MSARADRLAALRDLVGTNRLTPVQRRIVQTIAEHLDDADTFSSAELAAIAGVSQPSVTRLASALGFASYPELRQALRALARDDSQPVESMPRLDAVRDEIANLTWMERQLTAEPLLAEAGRRLAGSVPLLVIGLRASAPLAAYLSFYARKVHQEVITVDRAGSDGIDAIAEAHARGANAALVLALPRWPRELLALAEVAGDLGIDLVTIADRAHGPIQSLARVSLVAPVGTSLLYDTHASAFVLAQLLVQAIADAEALSAKASMEAFEERASRYRYFLRGET